MILSRSFISAFLNVLLTAYGGEDLSLLATSAVRNPRTASDALNRGARQRVYQGAARACPNPRASMQDPERRSGLSSFGALLRRHRLAAGLSQEALAERARLSPHGISALERGYRRVPQRQTMALLADALRLSGIDRAQFEFVARSLRPTPDAFAPAPLDGKAM